MSQVVKVRSQSMAAAAAVGKPHGMLSVVGLEDSVLQRLCGEVLAAEPEGTVCRIANNLFEKASGRGAVSVVLSVFTLQ